MKIIALNGSPLRSLGNTAQLVKEFLNGAREAGSDVEEINITNLKINPCLGKLVCWINTPGKCCQNDDMASLLKKLKGSDVWVFASPVYWDGVTGPMKNVLDRLLPLLEPYLELIDGHCRHALRPDVKAGKIVLISTCGFWELDNFEPMLTHLKAICVNAHREFAGALLRPHGAHFKYMVKNDKTAKDILAAAHTAGSELVNDGMISQDTLSRVSQEVIAKEEYIEMLNLNFDKLILKYRDAK